MITKIPLVVFLRGGKKEPSQFACSKLKAPVDVLGKMLYEA